MKKCTKILKRITVVIAGLYVLFLLFGFFGIPLILTKTVAGNVSEYLNGSFSIGKARFNPFLLRLTADNLSLKDADGESVSSLDRIVVDLEMTSIFRREAVLKTVNLKKPMFSLIRHSDGSMNIQTLSRETETPVIEEELEDVKEFKLPPVDIEILRISDGVINFKDETAGGFTNTLKDLTFTVSNFSTSPTAENQSGFYCLTRNGTEFVWEGNVMFNPFSSKGMFSVLNFQPSHYSPYYSNLMNAGLQRGTVDLMVPYSFDPAASDPVIAIEDASLGISNIVVQGNDENVPFHTMEKILFEGINVDVTKGNASLKTLLIDGGELRLHRGKDNVINLVRYFLPEQTSPEKSVEESLSEEQSEKPQEINRPKDLIYVIQITVQHLKKLAELTWNANLENLELSNQTLIWTDEVPEQIADLSCNIRRLEISNISTAKEQKASLDLDAVIGSSGRLELTGDISTFPPAANLKLKVFDVDLSVLSAYTSEINGMQIPEGAVSVDAGLKVSLPENRELAEIELVSDIVFAPTTFSQEEIPFLKWGELAIRGISLSSGKSDLKVREISLVTPEFVSGLDKDGTLSLLKLIPPSTESPEVEQSLGDEKDVAEDESWNVFVGQFSVRNGSVEFYDKAVGSGFTKKISDIYLTVESVSLSPDANIRVAFHGTDRNSVFTAEGKIAPFGETLNLELAIGTENLVLPDFSPYTSRYIGYPLTSGRLSLSQSYIVQEDQLKGELDLNIDNINLGNRTDSPDAVKLPLKLALALLKDRNGQIDLPPMEIEGDLGDPSFRFGKVVWYTVSNIFVKAAAAPFSLLTNMFGGAEQDLQHLVFEAGTAEISADETKKLEVLAKAMNDRPGLALKILPSVDPGRETSALKEEMLARNLEKIEKEFDDTVKTRNELMAVLYSRIFPGSEVALASKKLVEALEEKPLEEESAPLSEEEKLPAAPRTLAFVRGRAVPLNDSQQSGREDGAVKMEFQTAITPVDEEPMVVSAEQMKQQLLDQIKLTDEVWNQLAERRAFAVYHYLHQAGIPPAHLEIAPKSDEDAINVTFELL